jgi:hypothetical protein
VILSRKQYIPATVCRNVCDSGPAKLYGGNFQQRLAFEGGKLDKTIDLRLNSLFLVFALPDLIPFHTFYYWRLQ